jgi:acyl carrier protein
MFSEDQLKRVVASVLKLDVAGVGDGTSTDTVAEWDSIAHMNLVIALEETFEVSFPDSEVLSLTSYPVLRASLRELLGDTT